MRNNVTAAILAVALLVGGVTLGVTQSEHIQSWLTSKNAYQTETVPATQTSASSDVQGSLQISSAANSADQTLSAQLNDQAPAAGTTETAPAAEAAPAPVAESAPAVAEAPKADAPAAAATVSSGDHIPAAPIGDGVERTKEAAAKAEAAASSYTFDVAKALEDHIVGSPMAPITVYDYSSLSCPHCAAFHNEIFPKVKENYIDKGKIRWVYRTYPLNDLAIRAEMVARCAPNDQYLKLRDLMFREQRKWAFDEQGLTILGMLVRVAGITEDMFASCTNNKELEEGIGKIAQEGTDKYKISSTPTFIFNDGARKLAGAGSYEGFSYEVDHMLEAMADDKNAREHSTPVPAGSKLDAPATTTPAQ